MYLKVIEMDICVVRHNLCFVIFLDESFEILWSLSENGREYREGNNINPELLKGSRVLKLSKTCNILCKAE